MYKGKRLAAVKCGKLEQTDTAGVFFWTWMKMVFRIS